MLLIKVSLLWLQLGIAIIAILFLKIEASNLYKKVFNIISVHTSCLMETSINKGTRYRALISEMNVYVIEPILMHRVVNLRNYKIYEYSIIHANACDKRNPTGAIQFIILNICTGTATSVYLLLLTSINKTINSNSAEASALDNYLEGKLIRELHSRVILYLLHVCGACLED